MEPALTIYFKERTDPRLIFVKYVRVGYSSDDRFVRALGFRLCSDTDEKLGEESMWEILQPILPLDHNKP